MFFTSFKGSHTEITLREIGEHVSLIWGSSANLAGVIKSKDKLHIGIPLENYDVTINGQQLSDTKNPLLLIFTNKHRLTYLSLKNKFKSIRLSIDEDYFSSLYEQITGIDFSIHSLRSSFLSFKNLEQKKQLLDVLLPLTKELSSASTSDDLDLLADEICKLLINSLSTETIPPMRSYCNTLALRAHEIILNTKNERLSITEICEMLNASSRSLQKGFKAVYEIGFIEFHRLYRLNKIREHIRTNGVRSGELTNLMGMFGFTHAGRFSQEYKKAFGILPSKEEKLVLEKSIFL